jgi:hypothetical protein
MVDSLPPSGTDPDSKTIITNSNDELSVPLDGGTLAVGSSGEVEVFETTQYLASFEDNDSGDWTGIDSVSNGIAKVDVAEGEWRSASVTADLTGIDVLTFKIDLYEVRIEIYFDGDYKGYMHGTQGFETLEIDGLDYYGPNTTVKIESQGDYDNAAGNFRIDYVRGLIQPESRKVELVDTGGL